MTERKYGKSTIAEIDALSGSGEPLMWWHEAVETMQAMAAHIRDLQTELETERMRLAACGVAALGYFEGCNDEYRSASLEDVLQLRERHVRELRAVAEAVRDEVVKTPFPNVNARNIDLDAIIASVTGMAAEQSIKVAAAEDAAVDKAMADGYNSEVEHSKPTVEQRAAFEEWWRDHGLTETGEDDYETGYETGAYAWAKRAWKAALASQGAVPVGEWQDFLDDGKVLAVSWKPEYKPRAGDQLYTSAQSAAHPLDSFGVVEASLRAEINGLVHKLALANCKIERLQQPVAQGVPDDVAATIRRYEWLKDQFSGCDFNWNESGQTMLCFKFPDGVRVGADLDDTIGRAMLAAAPDGEVGE
jgi:hypothetical protein